MIAVSIALPALFNRGTGASDILFRYSAGDPVAALNGIFYRPSSATYNDVAGINRTASEATLRDSHYVRDPSTGLYVRTTLLERQATNYCLFSETFNDAASGYAWYYYNATMTFDAAQVNPNGVTGCYKVTIQGGVHGDGNAGMVSQIVPDYLYGPHTGSIWLKGTAGQEIYLYLYYGSDGYFGGPERKTVTFTGSWQRESVTWGGNNPCQIALSKSGFDNEDDMPTASTFYLWGAQIEPGTRMTSYVPSLSSVISRSADGLIFDNVNAPDDDYSVYLRFIDQGASRDGREILRLDGPDTLMVVAGAEDSYQVDLYGYPSTVNAAYQPSSAPTGSAVELLITVSAMELALTERVNGSLVSTRSAEVPGGLSRAFTYITAADAGDGSVGWSAAWRNIMVMRGVKAFADFAPYLS